ncbi:MAG: hypothetical protein CM1200mP35_05550 [Chloroflexota bacterium]|nr:MAG: hypothetical protein CM1200mP35_05550 [Chloroflexota bacterium]
MAIVGIGLAITVSPGRKQSVSALAWVICVSLMGVLDFEFDADVSWSGVNHCYGNSGLDG